MAITKKVQGQLDSIAGDPIRTKVFNLLMKNKSMFVNEMLKQMDIDASLLSHHLSIMKNSKTLTVEKDGRKRLYSINEGLSFIKGNSLSIKF